MQGIAKRFFDFFIHSTNKTNCFLATLYDDCTYLYEKLTAYSQDIGIKAPHLILNEEVIFRMIATDMPFFLVHLITRAHLVEMNACRNKYMLKGETSEQRFLYYIEAVSLPQNLAVFYQKYPELENLKKKFLDNYLAARQSFFSHLMADYGMFTRLISVDTDNLIINIESVSEPHCNAKSTLKVTLLSSGQPIKLIYKPINYYIDAAYQKFIVFFSTLSNLPLYSPKALYFNDHCWVEYIQSTSCKNEREVKKFYENAGCLLACLYFLRATDVHFENIIAHQAYPYLIDSECLISHALSVEQATMDLLRTNFIPPIKNVHDDTADFSGLGGLATQLSPELCLDYEDRGTDTMRCIKRKKQVATAQNIPRLNQCITHPSDYSDALIKGFKSAYLIFIKNRFNLIKLINEVFLGTKSRLIIRPTCFYQKLLQEIAHPLHLKDLTAMKRYLTEQLTRGNFKDEFIDSEIDSLMQYEIPYFYSFSDGREIFDNNDKFKKEGYRSGFDCVIQGIQHASEHDLNLKMIEIAQALNQSNNKQLINT